MPVGVLGEIRVAKRKRKTGKQLEALVAFVEREMLPPGFKVEVNDKVWEDGVQVAEFDVAIKGRLGSTEITWLIECRDRSGREPVSWIEQLHGRRRRFGWNRVTAVSTTGFVKAALKFAAEVGIEAREVKSLAPTAFDWLQIETMTLSNLKADLKRAVVIFEGEVPEEIAARVRAGTGLDALLTKIADGTSATLPNAFAGIVNIAIERLGRPASGETKRVRVRADYTNDADHFEVHGENCRARVRSIFFEGDLTVVETILPVVTRTEYRVVAGERMICQQATFQQFQTPVGAAALSITMLESGEQLITLQRPVEV